MFGQVLKRVFGTQHERDVKRLMPLVDQINLWEGKLKEASDDQLKAKTPEFKERIGRGEALDLLLAEAFAVCREASVRALGMRHYDVQLIGGVVLHRGTIAEMKTGEGKTLVATLPVYLNALTGRGVHIVTVNDYLASRDTEWMGRIYNWLGLSVGTITHSLSDSQRQKAYHCDITYGTNNEFGFDYLRDNMKFDLEDYVQRELHYAIVDECDSILIDEARTPLIISGPSEDSTDKYYLINKVVPHLEREKHFTIEEKTKSAMLTDEGNSKVEELLKIDNLYDPSHIFLLHMVYQGLKAYHLYRRDVEYMVKDNEILIVDEFTGRLMPGRRWSDGLHQAIEAKEGVKVKTENQTLATITFQNYFRMYKKLAGMTGTAETEAVEFKKIYNLDVSVIPTNKKIARTDHDDEIYKTEKAKFQAIADDILERNENGQPVLVGTVSIEKSELLSQFMKKAGIRHNVLNAKHHEREAEIIAQAGRQSAVTIATNMAGRGTDILLGGNPEVLTRHECPDETDPQYAQVLKRYRETTAYERRHVVSNGGLYIIGTERHESRRIDNQLRGRSGRQGDPGESRFYLSLEDDLMRIFHGERLQKIMTTLKMPDNEPIMAPMVSRAIENAQKRVEAHNFDIRKHLIEYDDVMNKQRTFIYGLRRQVLQGEELYQVVLEMLGEVTSHFLELFAGQAVKREDWDLDGLNSALNKLFGVQLDFGSLDALSVDKVTVLVSTAVKQAFDQQQTKLGDHFSEILRVILLRTIDVHWKEHLQTIDHLKEGINLRAYAQRDPLVEYKKEAFQAFAEMTFAIQADALEKIFKVQIVSEAGPNESRRTLSELDHQLIEPSNNTRQDHPQLAPLATRVQKRPEATDYDQSDRFSREARIQQQPLQPIRAQEKVGRNDPCPCGSGKKFKKCHGAEV